MLGGDDDGVDAHGAAVGGILHGHLALGVGAQIGHDLALAADGRELFEQGVAQGECHGYVERGLVGGIAKHHALVAGALLLGGGAVDAAVDVGALLVHGQQHAARVAVEAQVGAVVSGVDSHAAGHVHYVDICLGAYLACDHYLAGGDEGLAGYF